MNYLQIGQRLQLKCGVSGTLNSMSNQIGQLGRLVAWVNEAWVEIQNTHDDWDWMRSSRLLGQGASFETVNTQAVYPLGQGAGQVGILPDRFGKWDEESFRVFTTAVGTNDETFLDRIPYDAWRDSYMFGAMQQTYTRPVAVAIAPDQSVCIGPPSNGLYTVTGDYWLAASEMSADTDVPAGLPTRFHMAIVYKAMQKYGFYESAPEVKAEGDDGWDRYSAELDSLYLPRATMGSALF